MAQSLTIPIRGVFSAASQHGEMPVGALVRGENVNVRGGYAIPRRGLPPVLGSPASSVVPYRGVLILHDGTTLSYTDAGVTTATPHAGSYAPPAGRRVRFTQSGGNLYATTSSGIKKSEAPTSTPIDAGIAPGLDVQGTLTGSTGFMPADSAVSARAVWAVRDANGNLVLGAPSGRAVVANSTGGSRDVTWHTTVPDNLPAGAFLQIYRSAPSVAASVDPGDELGLVSESAAPVAASVTQIARGSGVATAQTATAHGFVAGQMVRISPGGSIAVAGVALGSSGAGARSTDLGVSWSTTGITGLSGTFNAVTWAEGLGLYVAVGTNVCATSPDGLTWTPRTIPAGTYMAVAWMGTRCVAIGSSSICATSTDGVTWSTSGVTGLPAGVSYRGLTWNGSTLVAVALNHASGNGATSPDGLTWTARTIVNVANAYVAVTWTGTRFVAAPSSGAQQGAYSSDGVTWTACTGFPAGTFFSIAWSGTACVAVGASVACSSADGISFTSRTLTGTHLSVCWNGVSFVAVGSSVVATAPANGQTWTAGSIPAGGYQATVSGGGAVFETGEHVITSVPDERSFTYPDAGMGGVLTSPAQTATPLTAVVVDDFPAIASGATLYTSPSQEGALAAHYEPPTCKDLTTFRGSVFWLSPTEEARTDLYLLAVGAPQGVQPGDTITINGVTFTAGESEHVEARPVYGAAVGSSNTWPRTADRGATWSLDGSGALGTYRAVAWSNTLGLFAAVGDSACATSPDGRTWTPRAIPAGTYHAVAWTGARFVAIGASSICSVSTDGASWSTSGVTGIPAANTYRALAWSGSLLVAVGDGGGGKTNCITSPDGLTWTSRTLVDAGNSYASVTWHGSASQFVAGPLFGGVNTQGAYSSDGATWTASVGLTTNQYYAAASSGEAVILVGNGKIARSSEGTIFTEATVSGLWGGVCWNGSAFVAVGADVAATGTADGTTWTPRSIPAGTYNATTSGGGATFKVTTTGTPSERVRDTVASLVRVVNRAPASAAYCWDMSSANDVPGKMNLRARARGGSLSVSISRASSWAFAQTTWAPLVRENEIRWSPQDMPDASQVTAFARVGSSTQVALRVMALRDSAWVLKEDGVWRLTGDRFDYASPPVLQPFDTTTEIVGAETAASLDNVIFALSTKGVVQISDTGVTVISGPIRDQIDALLVEPLRSTVESVAFGVAYESEGKYLLAVPEASSDTQSTRFLVYDHFESQESGVPTWTTWTTDAKSGTVNPADGKLYLGTSTNLLRERKTLDYTDLADEEYAVTVSTTGTTDTVTLADATNALVGDMLVQGASVGVVLSKATNTLTLDRSAAWTAAVGTVYRAIPTVTEFAPIIPGKGGWVNFHEVSFLYRYASGGYWTIDYASELAPSFESVPVYGIRDYGLLETSLAPFNLRTWVTRDAQRAARLKVRHTHSQARSPFALEGVSLVFTPVGTRLAR